MSEHVLDVFGGDAFNLVSMVKAVSKVPFPPQRIGAMGIFAPEMLTTDVAMIDEEEGVLTLLATGRRGGPGQQHKPQKATTRAVGIPQITVNHEVLAKAFQNARVFGSTDQVKGIQGVVNKELASIVSNIAATLEHMRITTIAGKTLDSDGSTEIVDWFDFAGVTEKVLDFDFGTAGTNIKEVLTNVKRHIEDQLGGVVINHVHGFAGNDWWDAYIKHAKVEAAFDRWENGRQLRDDFRFSGFEFNGVIVENYRGKVGAVDFVPTDVCRFFPVGGGDIFSTAFAPGDFIEAVGAMALPLYASQEIMDHRRGINMLVQTNPLTICKRPDVLVKGTKS